MTNISPSSSIDEKMRDEIEKMETPKEISLKDFDFDFFFILSDIPENFGDQVPPTQQTQIPPTLSGLPPYPGGQQLEEGAVGGPPPSYLDVEEEKEQEEKKERERLSKKYEISDFRGFTNKSKRRKIRYC